MLALINKGRLCFRFALARAREKGIPCIFILATMAQGRAGHWVRTPSKDYKQNPALLQLGICCRGGLNLNGRLQGGTLITRGSDYIYTAFSTNPYKLCLVRELFRIFGSCVVFRFMVGALTSGDSDPGGLCLYGQRANKVDVYVSMD